MIPKTLHQIWIGPLQAPLEWMASWRDQNPAMEYVLWEEEKLEDFGFKFQDRIEYLISEGRLSVASDIMRVEILDRLGGVYVDADSVCVKPIESAPFMEKDFFAVRDYDHKKKLQGQVNLVANGTIGSTAGHPVLKDYLKRIGETKATGWWEYGARMLTDSIKGHKVVILPSYAFYPKNWDGRKAPAEGANYAYHKWGTTTGSYNK